MSAIDILSLVICWGASTSLWLWFHLWGASEYPNERRAYLRFAWLAPLWPLVLLWVGARNAGKSLWASFEEAWL